MNNCSRNSFVHSVKVPRLYKTASVIAQKVVEEGGSLKDLVYKSGHKNIKGVYALVVETIKHSKELDKLIKNSKLLKNETRLQPWLARILLTELLYGKKELKGDSKPVKTVLLYKEKFEKLLKNEKNTPKLLETTVKKPRYVRVNTLQHTADEVIKIFRNEGWIFLPPPEDYPEFLKVISNLDDYSFTRDFHIKELLVFSPEIQFYENELYQNGSIILQDKASCLPSFLLKPHSHSVVLDMCAAPGMKTTHLSALMRNKGKIYATEIDPKRYKVLCDMVNNAGCTNVTTENIDAIKLNDSSEDPNFPWCKDVEYILVDPSCSGSGIVDRINIFSNEKSDSKRLEKLRGFQCKLLKHALIGFPKVKRVVYSTCSIHPQENEMVVEDVLKTLNNLTPEENLGAGNRPPKFRLAEPLKETWQRRGDEGFEHGKCCIYSNPEEDLTNGFFIAVFERVEDESEDVEREKSKKKKKSKEKTLEEEEKNDNGDDGEVAREPDLTVRKRKKRSRNDTTEEELSPCAIENDFDEEPANKTGEKKRKHKRHKSVD